MSKSGQKVLFRREKKTAQTLVWSLDTLQAHDCISWILHQVRYLLHTFCDIGLWQRSHKVLNREEL